MKVSRSLAAFLFLNFICIHSVSAKKKDDRPVVRVREGDTINLTCDKGSVTSETLYAVKWYRDEKEFFRNYPKAENPTKVYPIEGFTLETPLPNPWQVILHDVKPSASGKYTCMVVDYPRYRTIYRSTIVEVASKNDTLHQSHPPHTPGGRSSSSVFTTGSSVFYVSIVFIVTMLVFEVK